MGNVSRSGLPGEAALHGPNHDRPENWNPRFVQYARVHGREPQAQLDHDRNAWPGGIMAGFSLWISDRWGEWHAARGLRRTASGSQDHVLTDADHDSFDAWLPTLPVVAE